MFYVFSFCFFIFEILAFHPSLEVVDKNSSIGLVLLFAGVVSIGFSFLLILYSVSNFLKQRSKQFAILNILGTSKKQFRKIVFYENGIISIAALILGLILGLVFSKFFLMVAERIIEDLSLPFYFPITALLVTLLMTGGMFVLISLIAPIVLRKQKIINLLKKEEEAEKSYFIYILIVSILSTIGIYILDKYYDFYAYPLYLVSFVTISYVILSLVFMSYEMFMKLTNKSLKGIGLIKIKNFRYFIQTNLKTMTISLALFSIILTSLVFIVGAPGNVKETTKK